MTLEDLEAVVLPDILARGRTYWEGGHVRLAFSQTGQLQGVVAGSLGDYRVRVIIEQKRIYSTCECPYKQGFCKHAAALVWGYLNAPASFIKMQELKDQIEQMGADELRRVVERILFDAPQVIAAALDVESCPLDGRIMRAFFQRLRQAPKRPGWLRAWRRVLQIIQEHPIGEETNGFLEQLLRLGLAQMRAVDALEQEECFWDIFRETLVVWRVGHDTTQQPPSWWDGVKQTLPAVSAETRLRLAELASEELAADWAGVLLPTLGYPPTPEDKGFLYYLEITLAFLLRSGGNKDSIWDWALASLEHILPVMDLLEHFQAWQLLKKLAQAGLKKFSRENQFIFRARLALAHRNLAENRQALALMKANFKERPGFAEFVELATTAEVVEEREETLASSYSLMKGCERWDLLARAYQWVGDLKMLAGIAGKFSPVEPLGAQMAESLRAAYPKVARRLWEERVIFLLEQGTRRSAREAVPLVTALKRVCREEGWFGQWEMIRQRLRSLLLDPVSRETMGALLES